MKLVTRAYALPFEEEDILIHTSVKLVTLNLATPAEAQEALKILIHPSVKLVTALNPGPMMFTIF